jgi:hypothetical protein
MDLVIEQGFLAKMIYARQQIPVHPLLLLVASQGLGRPKFEPASVETWCTNPRPA